MCSLQHEYNLSTLQPEYPDFNSCIQEKGSKIPTICKFPTSDTLQLTYFCGSAPICKDGGQFDVIQRAKVKMLLKFKAFVHPPLGWGRFKFEN